MVVLDKVELCGYTSLNKISPSKFVLTSCKCFHSGGHCSEQGKGLVTPHQDVLGYTIGELEIYEVFLIEPLAEVVCSVNQ
jgi:hypothetical protein